MELKGILDPFEDPNNVCLFFVPSDKQEKKKVVSPN